ncbi:MAG: 30S ribosomal protein S20 [Gemmatimonadota bacterium]|nr:MAG: 30S ribosomal protein S20 [Gemmatimonadota bacterium]
MPNSSSAKKRMRQALRRNSRNRVARSALRTAIKRVRTAPADAADAAFRTAERLLDRAASKGLIHRNAAARSKRRLRRFVTSKS